MARAKNDHRRAADWLRRLLRVDPLQGRVVALLMEELEAAGEREDAIAVGDRYVADLAREWEAAPDPRVRDLLTRLRMSPAKVESAPLVPTPPRRCELELVRGTFAGRYDVLEELGGGGAAKVFLGWDPRLRRRPASADLR